MTQTLKKQTDIVAYNVEAIRFIKQTIELEQREREFVDINLKSEHEVRSLIDQKHLSKKRRVVL